MFILEKPFIKTNQQVESMQKGRKNISSMKKKPGILASSTNEKQSSSHSPQWGEACTTAGTTTIYVRGPDYSVSQCHSW